MSTDAAEVAELQRIIREHFSRAEREMTDRFHAGTRAEATERDAREAVGLLRECLPYVDSHAKASHMMDGFRRQPANDHDNLALRVAAAIATTEQAAAREPVRDQDGNAICTCTYEALCPLHEERAGP